MNKLFWLMLPIVSVTVAGIFVVIGLTVDMVDLKTMPIIAAVGFVVGVVGTFMVAKSMNGRSNA